MRFRLPLLIGLLLALSPLAAGAQVYRTIKMGVQNDRMPDPMNPLARPMENDIAEFVSTLFKEEELTPADVMNAMEGDYEGFCADREGGCVGLMLDVQKAVSREERVRSLGRSLQTGIAGYEMAQGEFPGLPLGLPGSNGDSYADILQLWSAGSGRYVTGRSGTGHGLLTGQNDPYLITIDVDDDDIKDQKEEVMKALGEITDPIELRWLVRRYQNGVRLVRGEREPEYPAPEDYGQAVPGTSLQYDQGRWMKLEDALLELWSSGAVGGTDEGTTERIGSIKFEDPSLRDGIILWARVGKPKKIRTGTGGLAPGESDLDPLDDIGLAYDYNFTPAFPPLFAWGHYGCAEGTEDGESGCGKADNPDDLILGGTYPPEAVRPIRDGDNPDDAAHDDEDGNPLMPVDGRGLCTHPRARNGYLCRTSDPDSAQCQPEPGDPEPDPNVISLVTCAKVKWNKTPPVANICRQIAWRKTPAHWEAPAKVDDPHTQCAIDPKVDITCGNCNFEGGQTIPKNEDGRIKICLGKGSEFTGSGETMNATYVLLHELAHAEQYCPMKPGKNIFKADPADRKTPPEKQEQLNCCRLEGEANNILCQEMARDGVFIEPDGSPSTVEGIKVTAATCAEAWTSQACEERVGHGCPVSYPYPQNFKDGLVALIKRSNPADVPEKCEDAIDPEKMDPRVRDMITRLNGRYDVCTPLNPATYGNRIGNNLCYMAECSREIADYHLIEGGRAATNVGDEGMPWDHITETVTKASLEESRKRDLSQFPDYRPELLVQQLDAAVCESVGLPPLYPVVHCLLGIDRRLSAPYQEGGAMMQDILHELAEGQARVADVERLSAAVGVRVAEKTHEGFENTIAGAFGTLLKTMNDMLDELKNTAFPDQMCPVDDTRPTPKNPSEAEDPFNSSAQSSA